MFSAYRVPRSDRRWSHSPCQHGPGRSVSRREEKDVLSSDTVIADTRILVGCIDIKDVGGGNERHVKQKTTMMVPLVFLPVEPGRVCIFIISALKRGTVNSGVFMHASAGCSAHVCQIADVLACEMYVALPSLRISAADSADSALQKSRPPAKCLLLYIQLTAKTELGKILHFIRHVLVRRNRQPPQLRQLSR
jgi:hypothetical protein